MFCIYKRGNKNPENFSSQALISKWIRALIKAGKGDKVLATKEKPCLVIKISLFLFKFTNR